ncbi:hypothetical protein BH23ACT11_BH23ACT11_16030 [soil metagenome]
MKVISKRVAGSGTFGSGNNERGFTLPEVLITIVILGMLVAIAIPSWQAVVEGRRVDSAANQFSSDLRLAHTRATNQLKTWKLVHSPGSSSYELVPEGGTAIPRSLPDGTKVLDTEVLALAGDRTIVFDPDGSAEAEGTFDDSLINPNGNIDVAVSSDDDAPKAGITIVEATSRVKLD